MKTTKTKIVSHLRQLWLRSKERGEALKRDEYTCQECGVKRSKAKGMEQKVEVHHTEAIDWDKIERVIRKYLLVNPSKLKTLCPDCHRKEEK